MRRLGDGIIGQLISRLTHGSDKANGMLIHIDRLIGLTMEDMVRHAGHDGHQMQGRVLSQGGIKVLGTVEGTVQRTGQIDTLGKMVGQIAHGTVGNAGHHAVTGMAGVDQAAQASHTAAR